VIETIDDMPAGTLGFRASGRVSAADYRDVLRPALDEAAESGSIRLLFAIGPGFEAFEPGALVEDSKVGIRLGVGHPHAWKRTAIVTDEDWIAKAIHLVGWMTPGELMVTGLDGLASAREWVAAG
jgi:hypothetical protein